MARIIKKGSKATKSDSVTVRLDPKLRYLADIAARSQRRSLSAFIEWAVEGAISNVAVKTKNGHQTLLSLGEVVWDIDESDRFVKLALIAPDILSYDEQRVWKFIKQFPNAFLLNPESDIFNSIKNIDFENINSQWELIQIACFDDENSHNAILALKSLDDHERTNKTLPF